MPENNDPKVEPVGQPREEEQTDTLETLRSDVEAMKASIKEEVVTSFRDELKKLSEPKTDKLPDAAVTRKRDVSVLGHASDALYRGLPEYEKPLRNQHSDALAQKWLIAVRNGDFQGTQRYTNELNELVRANEIAEGTASATGGISAGTGGPVIPVPLANIISETRNRRAKIRQRAQIFTSANESLRVPTHGVMTAAMVAEGGTLSNSGDSFDTVILSKKKMGVRFSITDEMLADSPFNLVSYFTRRSGEAMGQLEDVEFSTSTGSSAPVTQPLESIGGETFITPTLTNRVSYPDIVSLVYSLGEQWTENASFFGNANALRLLSSVLDANGRPIFTPSVSAPATVGDQIAGNVGTIFGRPVVQLPLTTSGANSNIADIWFGDLREYAILDGGGFVIRASEHVEFDNGRVVYKIEQRIDGAVLQSAGFARMAVSGTNNVGLVDTFV